MIYEIDKYTDFLCNAKINPTQFFICWLLHNKDYKNLKKYLELVGVFNKEDFKDLIDKGYLLNSNPNATSYDIINLFVTPEFAEYIIIEEDEAFEQLMEAYPDYVLVNGRRFPAKGLKLDEEKGVRELYGKIIKKNKFLHFDIITITKEWKVATNNEATIKIDKYVVSRYWEQIRNSNESTNKPRIH